MPWQADLRCTLLFLLSALLPFCTAGIVEARECILEENEGGRVADIVDGDTLLLDDGREVRLTGIQAPKLPLGRTNFKTWPLAPEARETLAEIAMGRRVTLQYGGESIDRHGRVLAHVFIEGAAAGPVWAQQEMLRRGLARVYTFRDNRACSAELLAAEESARAEGLGIWNNAYYDIRNAVDIGQLSRQVGRFEIVEGKIVSAALFRDRLYLNFGEDYRQDFTVTVSGRNVKLFKAEEPWASFIEAADGTNVSMLAGKYVRVRGWVDRYNGLEIEVTHPEQIEFPREAE